MLNNSVNKPLQKCNKNFQKQLLSIKSVVKYVRSQLKLINKRCNEPFMRKTGNQFRKMDEKPLYSGEKLGRYRVVIWQTQRPRNLNSFCVMIYNRGARFFLNIASRLFKACIFIVDSWPGLFLTLRNGLVERPICLSQEALDGGAVAAHNCCC